MGGGGVKVVIRMTVMEVMEVGVVVVVIVVMVVVDSDNGWMKGQDSTHQ